MKTVVRNVVDMDTCDRQALEHVLGQSLHENEQLVIGIVNRQTPIGAVPLPPSPQANATPTLPDWCNVYEGLSDEEIADMEQTIVQRADLSRPSE